MYRFSFGKEGNGEESRMNTKKTVDIIHQDFNMLEGRSAWILTVTVYFFKVLDGFSLFWFQNFLYAL